MTADEGKATAKKTYEELERENAELRARLEKSEGLLQLIAAARGQLQRVERQFACVIIKG